MRSHGEVTSKAARRDDGARRARSAARAESAARLANPSRWGEEPIEADRLAALHAHGTDVVLDLRKRVIRAQRPDVWATLLTRGGLTHEQHEAIRRLERDILIRAGCDRANRDDGVVVDVTGAAGALTDRMIDAGKRVDAALAMVGPPSSRLLRALLEPSGGGYGDDWKDAVRRITGETHPGAQSALLRAAAQSLLECFEVIERERRRAFARASHEVTLR